MVSLNAGYHVTRMHISQWTINSASLMHREKCMYVNTGFERSCLPSCRVTYNFWQVITIIFVTKCKLTCMSSQSGTACLPCNESSMVPLASPISVGLISDVFSDGMSTWEGEGMRGKTVTWLLYECRFDSELPDYCKILIHRKVFIGTVFEKC